MPCHLGPRSSIGTDPAGFVIATSIRNNYEIAMGDVNSEVF